MRKVLVVYLKDTFYTTAPNTGGAAQWHYIKADADQLEEVVLGSGALAVFMPDEENGQPNEHLNRRRTKRVAFFPPGGWSGYAWEEIDEGATVMADAMRRGIAVPR